MDIKFAITDDGRVYIEHQSKRMYGIGLGDSNVSYEDIRICSSAFPEIYNDYCLFIRGTRTEKNLENILYSNSNKIAIDTFLKGIIALITSDYEVVIGCDSKNIILEEKHIKVLKQLIEIKQLRTNEIPPYLSKIRGKICKI